MLRRKAVPVPSGRRGKGVDQASNQTPAVRMWRGIPIPVLALTAQAMDGDRERFLAAGFDGYLSKPVDIAELVATVRRHCGERSR